MIRYILPIVLFIPAPVFAEYGYSGSMCVRTKKTVLPGKYDQFGRWHRPYTMEEDVVEPCNKLGYVPPVGRPAMTEETTERRMYSGQYSNGNRYFNSNQSVVSQTPLTRAQCRNRSIVGALAGAGTAAAVSKNNAYAWAIPLGAVAGIALSRSGECADLR